MKTELGIRKLGGKIVDSVGAASRVVFPSTKKILSPSHLFQLLLAAVSGKRLLPSNYVECSRSMNLFEDVR